ncbi:MAG TPA: hypothetical protein VJQ44_07620 [Gemmatimonadales bacterium]|nr:hypothetical protein [Gemmatimonadales bacterium]
MTDAEAIGPTNEQVPSLRGAVPRTDLQARGVVSPVDTPRVSAAERAVARAREPSGRGE